MQLKTQNLDSSHTTLKFAKYIMKKTHCVALRVLSSPDSHSHISWGPGKMKHSVLPEAETMEKDCAFHTSPVLVPSEGWQRYCFLLKAKVILCLWSLFKSWVFWKDTRWCCSYCGQQYDLIIWNGFSKFWSYTDLGYWFQKEKNGLGLANMNCVFHSMI